MSKIIHEFVFPIGKHDTTKAREAKQSIFRSTFNTYQRHEYGKVLDEYKDCMFGKFKHATIDSMSELSQLINNFDMCYMYNNSLDQYARMIWLSNLKTSIDKLGIDEDTINYFIVPTLYQEMDLYHADIMLVLAEIYHGLRTALNVMMFSIAYVNATNNYSMIDMYIRKFKEVMGTYHPHNMIHLLNPIESPLMVVGASYSVNESSEYSGTLYFMKHVEDMLEYTAFASIINEYTQERKGIDIKSIRETDDVRKFFIDYLNNADKKQQRNFISCLVKYYDKNDKDYVIRNNKTWLRKIIMELDVPIQDDIHRSMKLLNIAI